jgi:hypothetical protein
MPRYSPKWAERRCLLHADHQISGEYQQSWNEKESSAVEGLREFDDRLNQTKKEKKTQLGGCSLEMKVLLSI